MLRAEHVSVAYGAHRALDDVGLRVDEGEVVVMLGANGAGKSTLLKAIAGLVRYTGRISIGAHPLDHRAASEIVELGLALVPESRGIFGDLTVGENLALGAYGRQAREGSDVRLAEVLKLFPRLAERKGQTVRTMSGGEQQMVAVGRALMSHPKVLMLDEPSLGLSPLLSTELFKSLKQIQDTGVSILLVEQNARLGLAIADRAYLIENGHIMGEGRAAALAHDPAVQQAYLGGAASKVHKRFGEEETAMPLTPPTSQTPEALADRAARIQRDYIESRRNGPSQANGYAALIPAAASEPIVLKNQAQDLSRSASDLARRASDILATHIAAQREAVQVDATLGAAAKKAKKDKKKSRKAAKRAGTYQKGSP